MGGDIWAPRRVRSRSPGCPAGGPWLGLLDSSSRAGKAEDPGGGPSAPSLIRRLSCQNLSVASAGALGVLLALKSPRVPWKQTLRPGLARKGRVPGDSEAEGQVEQRGQIPCSWGWFRPDSRGTPWSGSGGPPTAPLEARALGPQPWAPPASARKLPRETGAAGTGSSLRPGQSGPGHSRHRRRGESRVRAVGHVALTRPKCVETTRGAEEVVSGPRSVTLIPTSSGGVFWIVWGRISNCSDTGFAFSSFCSQKWYPSALERTL